MGFIAISYGGSELRHRSILETITHRPTTLTFDLKFWKYLSVTVYPYVICMPSFIMIGWEMAEILHFEILRKHGQTNTHTNKHTDRQTWALQYLTLPLRGWGNKFYIYVKTLTSLAKWGLGGGGFNIQTGPILVHIYPPFNNNLHVKYRKQSDKNLLS